MAPINALDRASFVERFGPLFESSPWVAWAAWEQRPFADAPALLGALVGAVDTAPLDRQLALIRAHPDLAGRAAIAGELTAESLREQSSAGLDRLTAAEYETFTRLNTDYREYFGFPFVICVREHTKESILEAARERLLNDEAEEVRVALAEIGKIAWLRLEDAL
jgi:2-oxo-4-hydroxy-4-carboxy-5-ureidoimidazoline decarboxylase